jgi:hypothetical protein
MVQLAVMASALLTACRYSVESSNPIPVIELVSLGALRHMGDGVLKRILINMRVRRLGEHRVRFSLVASCPIYFLTWYSAVVSNKLCS